MYLVKSLILHNAGYMICLVHVKDDGVLVTPPWNQLRRCRRTNHIRVDYYTDITSHMHTFLCRTERVYVGSVEDTGPRRGMVRNSIS